MKSLFVTLWFISSTGFGFVNPADIESGFLAIENVLIQENVGLKFKPETKDNYQLEIKKKILTDFEDRISENFDIHPYFLDRVEFWFDIYTKHNSTHVIIHDMENLDLVYHILDFEDLDDSNLHRFTKAKLIENLSKEYKKKLREALKNFPKKALRNFTSFEKEIYRKIKLNYKLPKNRKKRHSLYKKLSKNIRVQLGQRDKIIQGLKRFQSYKTFFDNNIELFKLPSEIKAISFLESSFNPKAVSKVEASGAWQFMPYIGNLFMPRTTKYIDHRRSPVVSTYAAFHLLKQNIQILKRWDLAVTAYNSGTKHLIRARRKFKKIKNLDLAYILKNYQNKHLGFASKNFYSEFLALVHTLAYQELVFPKIDRKFEDKDIQLYVLKCPINFNDFVILTEEKDPNVLELNFHIMKKDLQLKRGDLVASTLKLNPKKYHKLKSMELKRKYPKNYYRYIYNKKCGRL